MTMCQQSYGFLPCTTTVPGNLFLMLVYGFLMYKGATYLSHGSELLLEIMGPGLVAGLLVPLLGALPEALTVLVSGLSGSRDTAQSQVLTGMGLLAGSTVFLLTLLWGTCVVVGKCDLGPNGNAAVDLTDTKGFSLTGTGVSIDPKTNFLARIMAISVVPFLVAGLPNMMKMNHHGQRLAVFLALIVSFLLALSYCLYQVSNPWIQGRRLAYVKHKLVISWILRHAQMHAVVDHQLLNNDGTPNEAAIRKLFHRMDMDKSRSISRAELHAFIVGINFEGMELDKAYIVDRIMDEFDTSRNDTVEEEEFVQGMKSWIIEATKRNTPAGSSFLHSIHDYHETIRRQHDELVDRPDEAEKRMENPGGWFIAKAVGFMLLGTAMAAAFADPLVDAVHNISVSTRIPPFLVSFVVLPLATNSMGEPVSALVCASSKRQRTATLTFSELYSGVAMKNTLCLGVFLSLIHARNLPWEFSSEMLMVVLVCVVVGLFTSFRTTFPLWTCLVAYTLYPLSLVVVYVLDHVCHWS